MIAKEEADIIVLLHDEKLCSSNNPSCETLDDFKSGRMKCKSMHNQVKVIPKNIKNLNLKFREPEISMLLQHLIGNEEQIVNIWGLCGMGKSALVRSIL